MASANTTSGLEKFGEKEKALLMALQYNFPLSEEPYFDLSDFTELKVDYIFEKTRDFLKKGVIKRIGAQLNYKAFREIGFAALVGARVNSEDITKVTQIINSYHPKHNYLRDDERYNVWFTIKERTPERLKGLVEKIMEECSVSDYVYLPSKRVYKMDVKYDLFRGVSYSEAGIENSSVPKVEEVGVNANLLLDLERNFKVEKRPFKKIAQNYGLGEGELISLIGELIELRIIRGFYAVLKERKIGFIENAMNMVEPEEKARTAKVALKLLESIPEITHLVEREIDEKWRYPLYFMVHASSKEPIEEIRDRALKIPGVNSIKTLYSLKDLKEEDRDPDYR
ncbi:Lrp/AsnC family transcriptional regulator [Archaeoglobales archaeon]|nr:MAG: Lrp/AsnC family transcriptional regulator [Archaeoglobales archaeon]